MTLTKWWRRISVIKVADRGMGPVSSRFLTPVLKIQDGDDFSELVKAFQHFHVTYYLKAVNKAVCAWRVCEDAFKLVEELTLGLDLSLAWLNL